MKTCYDEECKYFKEVFSNQNDNWDYHSYCIKHDEFLSEEKICEHYSKSKKCFNCNNSGRIIYETGVIDCIDYHCKLQSNILIFSDINWAILHYSDFPDCSIDKWEEKLE